MKTDKVCLSALPHGAGMCDSSDPGALGYCQWVKALNINRLTPAPRNPPSTRNVNFCHTRFTSAPAIFTAPRFKGRSSRGKCSVEERWPSLHNYFRNSALCFNGGQAPWLKSGVL